MSNISLLNRTIASAFYGKFQNLHSIQDLAISPVLDGKNVIISARTGGGKTEAVLAPILSKYLKTIIETDSLTILYISPTKALVNDLKKRISPIITQLNLRLGIRHGDHNDLSSTKLPHLLITTPESLEVILFRRDSKLKNIHAIILDEVHLLYNTQRGLQLSILLQRLKKEVDRNLQWAALSATMSNPQHIKDFLFGKNEDAVFIHDSTRREIDAYIRIIDSKEDLKNFFKFIMGPKHAKYLVFANSRRECEELANILTSNADFDKIVFAHYSSLSSELREENEKDFNILSRAICIATSTLELGIDIGDINAVILYGTPYNAESFLQRIGRGSRRTNKTNVISLVKIDSETKILDALIFYALIDIAQKGILPEKLPYELFGSTAQQILSVIGSMDGKFTRIADLTEMSLHLDHLNRESIEKILISLSDNKYLQPHGFKNSYGAEQKLYKLIDLKMIYGNFPPSSQDVPIYHGEKLLGSIPKDNILRITNGDAIRFAGRIWQIKKISIEKIDVIPSKTQRTPIDIIYLSSGISYDNFIINNIWNIINSKSFDLSIYDKKDRNIFQQFIESIQKDIKENNIPFFRLNNNYTYLTFAGKLINKAISSITNIDTSNITNISLSCYDEIDWNSIPIYPQEYEKILDELYEFAPEKTFYQTLIPVKLQKKEFWEVWVKDKTIPVILERLNKSIPKEIKIEKWKSLLH